MPRYGTLISVLEKTDLKQVLVVLGGRKSLTAMAKKRKNSVVFGLRQPLEQAQIEALREKFNRPPFTRGQVFVLKEIPR